MSARTARVPAFFRGCSTVRAWSGLLVLLCACAGCGTGAPIRPASAQAEIRIAVAEGGSESPDVGLAEVWRSFAYEGLTNRGNDGRPQPRLAQAWSVSPDGLRWTIELRPDAWWHDGQRFDAASAAEALRAVVLRRQRTTLYPGLLDVQSVEALEPDRLTLSVSQPSAFLADDLDIRLQRQGALAQPLGTGPFAPVTVTRAEVRMRAHERYHEGTPQIGTLILTSHPTVRQAWAGLLRGEVDALWNVSSDAAEFLNDQTIDARSFPRRYVYVMAFNSSRPQLRNPVVRRALNSAISRDALIAEALAGRGQPAWSPVWPEHWAYDNASNPFSYDPSLAKAALVSAGFPSTPRSSRLTFTCLVPDGFAAIERLALALQRAMYDVGVDLAFESVTLAEMETRMATGRFDAVLLDLLSGPSLSRVYSFWRSAASPGGLNVFGYRDRDVDDALDRLRRTVDDSSVRAATSQLQGGFARNPPGIFIAWSERSRAVSRRIETPHSPGRDPFQPLWQWRIKAAAGDGRSRP